MTHWLLRIIIIAYWLCPSVLSEGHVLDRQIDIRCLANILHYEVRGESYTGQAAVASVVFNRVRKANTTVCVEMAKPHQFSWHTEMPIILPDIMLGRMLDVARALYIDNASGRHYDGTFGASHFIAKGKQNYWTRAMRKTVVIGNHAFYKEMK